MMNNVNLLELSNDATLPNIAVAIAGSPVTGFLGQRHIGVLIGGEHDPVLLHLGWHNMFSLNTPPDKTYFWAEACVNINPGIVESFSDWLIDLWNVNQNEIGYSLIYDYNKKYFDGEDGALLIKAPGTGLTCATFVAECFKCFGLQFIDFSSWPVREEDTAWFGKMIEIMKKCKLPSEHIENQENADMGCRFRPEEVFAAAHLAKPKIEIDFDTAEPASKLVLNMMREKGKY
ncbi:hypothetical protein [Klebsiella oxytoca]|uniref:hypothetical protein n=1 Tax=Klebsiella oxytoca TaxID=571 RepID=UPI0020731F2F